MMPFKIIFRIIQILFLTLIIMYFNNITKGQVKSEKIPIGVIFAQNTEEIQNAFKFAMVQHSNHTRQDFQLYVDIINTADAFKLSRLICNQFARGVVSMLGAVTADSFDTLHSYTNTFQMPFVTPWFPEKVIPPSSGLVDYAVSLRPDYHRALIDAVAYYGWKHVIYIYDSHDGLLRLQQLYASLQPGEASFRITHVKRVSQAAEAVDFLAAIERLDRFTAKYVVLDCRAQLAQHALVLHVRDVHLGRRNYHYLLSGLVMDDYWPKDIAEFGAINVTGFRLLDLSRKVVRDFLDIWKMDTVSVTSALKYLNDGKANYINQHLIKMAQAALMYDSVQVLVDAIMRLLRKKPDALRAGGRRSNTTPATPTNNSRSMDCNPKGKIAPYEYGDRISRMIKKTDLEGLTGKVRFDEAGHRKNFSLQLVELTVHGEMLKVATWSDQVGLVPVVTRPSAIAAAGTYNRNKTYLVAMIEEPPYVMRASTGSQLLRGFCVDLTRMLAEKLEIKYELILVKDGKYGNENPKIVSGWDGIIGEIVRKEVDFAVAPLTVTLERESVVDFSKPFLSFDIKQYGKSVKEAPTIFSFLRPLSKELWLCCGLSLFAVSAVMYLVSRCANCEWGGTLSHTDASPTEPSEGSTAAKTAVTSELSFWNSVWFCVGSLLQQGSDVTPRSASGRIVGSVWWFFALVVVASYTANLASHLTLARIAESSHAYTKVAACPGDTLDENLAEGVSQDGDLDDHGWLSFFTDSRGESGEPCRILLPGAPTGLKDFAVALPKGAELRDGVNLALQALKDEGELQRLVREWFPDTESSLAQRGFKGLELSLSQLAGLFYVLVGGLVLALSVALLEFCQRGRTEAARARMSLGGARKARARPPSTPVSGNKAMPQRSPRRDRERLGWNGGAYAGYYTPSNQIGQEETALHASFTQV